MLILIVIYLVEKLLKRRLNETAQFIGMPILETLITHALGGAAEPGMFSHLLTNWPLMCIQIISAFLGSLYPSITKSDLYTPGISNFMAVFQFAGGETGNLRNAVIGCAASFITGFILTAVMQIRKAVPCL